MYLSPFAISSTKFSAAVKLNVEAGYPFMHRMRSNAPQPIADIFFKIGEVAKLAGVEQHVLRYWEDEFEALQPKKNKSGQRFYEKKDVELILKIQKLLYLERYTIAGAKKKMRENK